MSGGGSKRASREQLRLAQERQKEAERSLAQLQARQQAKQKNLGGGGLRGRGIFMLQKQDRRGKSTLGG